jgi:hypothetical protein
LSISVPSAADEEAAIVVDVGESAGDNHLTARALAQKPADANAGSARGISKALAIAVADAAGIAIGDTHVLYVDSRLTAPTPGARCAASD